MLPRRPRVFASALLCLALLVAAPAGAAMSELPAVAGIPVDFILFGLTLIGVALFHHYTLKIAVSGLAVITVYNILVPTALAFWCWSQALARIRASTASQVLLLSPVFGIAQSHFVLGEPLTPAVLASAACVITGACLTFWRPASAAPA